MAGIFLELIKEIQICRIRMHNKSHSEWVKLNPQYLQRADENTRKHIIKCTMKQSFKKEYKLQEFDQQQTSHGWNS